MMDVIGCVGAPHAPSPLPSRLDISRSSEQLELLAAATASPAVSNTACGNYHVDTAALVNSKAFSDESNTSCGYQDAFPDAKDKSPTAAAEPHGGGGQLPRGPDLTHSKPGHPSDTTTGEPEKKNSTGGSKSSGGPAVGSPGQQQGSPHLSGMQGCLHQNGMQGQQGGMPSHKGKQPAYSSCHLQVSNRNCRNGSPKFSRGAQHMERDVDMHMHVGGMRGSNLGSKQHKTRLEGCSYGTFEQGVPGRGSPGVIALHPHAQQRMGMYTYTTHADAHSPQQYDSHGHPHGGPVYRQGPPGRIKSEPPNLHGHSSLHNPGGCPWGSPARHGDSDMCGPSSSPGGRRTPEYLSLSMSDAPLIDTTESSKDCTNGHLGLNSTEIDIILRSAVTRKRQQLDEYMEDAQWLDSPHGGLNSHKPFLMMHKSADFACFEGSHPQGTGRSMRGGLYHSRAMSSQVSHYGFVPNKRPASSSGGNQQGSAVMYSPPPWAPPPHQQYVLQPGEGGFKDEQYEPHSPMQQGEGSMQDERYRSEPAERRSQQGNHSFSVSNKRLLSAEYMPIQPVVKRPPSPEISACAMGKSFSLPMPLDTSNDSFQTKTRSDAEFDMPELRTMPLNLKSDSVDLNLDDIAPHLMPMLMQKVKQKGKGGRSRAEDPRVSDPNIDPRKAKRILANRESAARSKLKQKIHIETMRVKLKALAEHKDGLTTKLQQLHKLCSDMESSNTLLVSKIAEKEGEASKVYPGGIHAYVLSLPKLEPSAMDLSKASEAKRDTPPAPSSGGARGRGSEGGSRSSKRASRAKGSTKA